MHRPVRSAAVSTVLVLAIVSCGGANTTDTTASDTTEPVLTTTTAPRPTTPAAPTTTSTVPPTTTTTVQTVEPGSVHATLAGYLEAIVAKQWDQARTMSTGSAAEYATFTEQLDSISTQPEWQLESSSEPDCCELVELADTQFATEATIAYSQPDGPNLTVSNPVVSTSEGSEPLLIDWGVDLGSGDTGPPLSHRLRDISVFPFDPSVCTSGSNWAYVPGNLDTSETVRVIVIGAVCDGNSDVTPDQSRTTIFTTDGTLDQQASIVLWEGGPNPIPAGEVQLFLALFDIPAEVAASDLYVGAGFQPANGQNYTFTIEIGAFDLN